MCSISNSHCVCFFYAWIYIRYWLDWVQKVTEEGRTMERWSVLISGLCTNVCLFLKFYAQSTSHFSLHYVEIGNQLSCNSSFMHSFVLSSSLLYCILFEVLFQTLYFWGPGSYYIVEMWISLDRSLWHYIITVSYFQKWVIRDPNDCCII